MSFAIHFRGTFTSRLLTRLLLHINRCPTWAFPPLDRTLRRPANSTYSACPPRSGLRRIDIYSKDSSSASALRLSAPQFRTRGWKRTDSPRSQHSPSLSYHICRSPSNPLLNMSSPLVRRLRLLRKPLVLLAYSSQHQIRTD